MGYGPQYDEVAAVFQQFGGAVILDHGSRNVRELDLDVVAFAEVLGFDPPFAVDPDDEDTGDAAYELACIAIDWLNNNRVIRGAYWGHDGDAGAFGVWKQEWPDDDEE